MKKIMQAGKQNHNFKALFIDAGFDLLFASATFFIALEFAEDSVLATGLLAAVFLVGMLKWRSRAVLIVALLFSFAGTLSEMAITARGVWEYSYHDFFGVPIFLFFIWSNAAVFIYRMGIDIREFFKEERQMILGGKDCEMIFPLIVCAAAFLSVVLFCGQSWILLAVNITLSALILLVWKSWTAFLIYAISAISGPSCEIMAINSGLWAYITPETGLIPVWLIFSWGIVGTCIYMTGENLRQGIQRGGFCMKGKRDQN